MASGLQEEKVELLTPDDYGFLFSVGANFLGIKTVTVTGGEPLVRKIEINCLEAIRSRNTEAIRKTIESDFGLLGRSRLEYNQPIKILKKGD